MPLPAEHAFATELSRPAALRQLLGSYWSEFYQDQTNLNRLLESHRQSVRQFARELQYQVHSLLPATAETAAEYTFYPYRIPAAAVDRQPLTYGGGAKYGDPIRKYVYGDYVEDAWTVPLPEQLVGLAAVASGTIDPQVYLVEGTECFLRHGRLQLSRDPREFCRTDRDADGTLYITLWLHMARFDRRDLATRHGRVFGVGEYSSEWLREALVIVHEVLRQSPTQYQLRRLLAAAVREPVAYCPQVVEHVLTDYDTPVVLTDKQRAVGEPGKRPAVVVGQTLRAGDFFFDTVQTTDFSSGVPGFLDRLQIPPRITKLESALSLPAGELRLIEDAETGNLIIHAEDAPPRLSRWLAGSGDWIRQSLRRTDPARAYPGQVADVLSSLAETTLRYGWSATVLRGQFLDQQSRQILRLLDWILPPTAMHVIQFADDDTPGWTTTNGCDINGL